MAIGLLVFFLATGTAGYSFFDGYSILDAFYMTVITISTVGYGEIQPLSQAGRIFTIFLIMSGVGSIAFAVGAFTEIVIERAANPNRWKKTMEKKISKLHGHVIICGHGRVGAAAAEFLKDKGGDFVVIESSAEGIKHLTELDYHFLQGDGTREETLMKAGIKKASALLAVLDSDPDNLFAVLTARELNPVLRIIARTEYSSSESRMLRAGADSVISPFVAAGQRVAESLLTKKTLSRDNLVSTKQELLSPKWFEVDDQSKFVNLSIPDAKKVIKGFLLGLRRGSQDMLMPGDDVVIQLGDSLLISQSNRVVPLDPSPVTNKKIVLIDDNPVILRLYTRLFQKAGYNIFSASNGEDGYSLIVSEVPDAAVIDFHLPDVTGLSVCRKVRALPELEKIKLFLFTANEQKDVKKRAKAAGVDKVVVKSPEAGEIVSMVSDYLA